MYELSNAALTNRRRTIDLPKLYRYIIFLEFSVAYFVLQCFCVFFLLIVIVTVQNEELKSSVKF
jgi:hypothetical protein